MPKPKKVPTFDIGLSSPEMEKALALDAMKLEALQAPAQTENLGFALPDDIANKIWDAYSKAITNQMPVQSPAPISSAELYLKTLAYMGPPKKKAKPEAKKRKAKGKKRLNAPTGKRTEAGSMSYPVTQKARGMEFLSNVLNYGGSDLLKSHPRKYLLPYNFPDAFPKRGRAPMFARPCPLRPRHGFVESRRVRDVADLLGVFQEATAADPNAEVMVMTQLTGSYSAVATDAGITYGVGNDGVTGKGDRLWRVPTAPGLDGVVTEVASCIENSAYIELVEDWGDMRGVQLRDGPAPPRVAKDFIPHADYKVSLILTAEGYEDDLLGWENLVAGVPPGTLIHAPDCALSSHIVVHGIARGLAVITDRDRVLPRVGDTLQPMPGTPEPLTVADYEQIARYVDALKDWRLNAADNPTAKLSEMFPGLALLRRDYMRADKAERSSLITMLGTLHSMSLWSNEPHLLRLRAFALVTMLRFLIAACIGEARHFYGPGPGSHGRTSTIDWGELGKRFGFSRSTMRDHRDSVYSAAFLLEWSELDHMIQACITDFGGEWGTISSKAWAYYRRHRHLPDGASCSFGGPKWRNAAKMVHEFLHVVEAFCNKPNEETWRTATIMLNKVVNAEHNGGKLLNKWLHSHEFDNAHTAAPLFFANTMAMRVIVGDHCKGPTSALDIANWKEHIPAIRASCTLNNQWVAHNSSDGPIYITERLRHWIQFCVALGDTTRGALVERLGLWSAEKIPDKFKPKRQYNPRSERCSECEHHDCSC